MQSYLDIKPGKGYLITPFKKRCIIVEADSVQINAIRSMLPVMQEAGKDETTEKEIEDLIMKCHFGKYIFKNYDCLPDKIKELNMQLNKGYMIASNNLDVFDKCHAGKLTRILDTKIIIDNIRLASLRKDN